MLGQQRVITWIFVLYFICAFWTFAYAGGYAIPPQTAKAESMGGAATAGVNDPSAIYVNAAALPYIEGNQAMAGLTYVNTISSVRNSGLISRNLCPVSLIIIPNASRYAVEFPSATYVSLESGATAFMLVAVTNFSS